MANPGYLRSTDGNNTDNGSTWALANADLAGTNGATTDAAAGDRIWVSHVHNESTAGAVTATLPGTVSSPNQVVCGNDGAEPPTALATTAQITTTAGNSITINGSVWWYGVNLKAGSGAVSAGIILGRTDTNHQTYESMTMELGSTAATPRISLGGGASGTECSIILRNVTMRFGNTGQGLNLAASQCRVAIEGGNIHASSSAITSFVATASTIAVDMDVNGFDFTNAATALDLLPSGMSSVGTVTFRSCTLPASWSGRLMAGDPVHMGFRARLHNCAAGDVQYALWEEDYAGKVQHETTVVRTGGANDGTTTVAWKITTKANTKYPSTVFLSPERSIWNDTVGSSVTLTVEIVHDSQGSGTSSRLRDDEIALEAMVMSTSGASKATWVRGTKADLLATAADCPDSSATWTTTGLTTPLKQKVSVTFTPQEKGPVIWRIACMGASDVIYVDPMVTVT